MPVCVLMAGLALCGLSGMSPASAQDAAQLPQRIALAPGEYLWMPELAPQGPLLVLVSLPEQLAYVYRNGVRIGVSTVSTGKAGHETPTGVFTILEKRVEHYSNLYDNAPMPYMQRLTWDGVALHAGRLPGYPASHGCVRLPRAFAEKLFAVTRSGTTVVIADRSAPVAQAVAPGLLSPGLLSPGLLSPGLSSPLDPAGAPAVQASPVSGWVLSPAGPGPVTVIASLRDRRVVVLRDGVEIGHAPLRVVDDTAARALRGTHLYLLLEGAGESESLLAPGRPAGRWQALQVAALGPGEGDVRAAAASGAIGVAPGFAQALYATFGPGSTVIVTDEPLGAGTMDAGERVLMETPAGDGQPEVPATPVPSPAPPAPVQRPGRDPRPI